MKQDIRNQSEERIVVEMKSALDELLREGARQMLQQAIENEVAEYLEAHQLIRDENGHRMVVHNGHMPERNLVTGVGPLPVKRPRVHDKRPSHRFTSAILPAFMRRVPSIDALIPVLYLKGVATNDFSEALEAILGPNAAGLSATNIVRLEPDRPCVLVFWASFAFGARTSIRTPIPPETTGRPVDDRRGFRVARTL